MSMACFEQIIASCKFCERIALKKEKALEMDNNYQEKSGRCPRFGV
jgi:hypothetical protein